MPFRLVVPKDVYAVMVAQALSERPNECCGFLAGVVETPAGGAVPVGRVTRAYPLRNEAASPTEYLCCDDRSLFEAIRDMRQLGLDVLAVYHSHPTSPPVPSRKDRERNWSEEVVNLIISLTTEPPTVRGWWLTASSSREAEWVIS
jgi:proteasome lid subunit RPN8/RPN11